jgi:hypothetical protein
MVTLHHENVTGLTKDQIALGKMFEASGTLAFQTTTRSCSSFVDLITTSD